MTNDTKKAKSYLNGTPLKVTYYLFPDPQEFNEYEEFFETEYPDYIPNEEEKVIFDNIYYIVLNKAYDIAHNTITVSITTKKAYDNMNIGKYSRTKHRKKT